MSDALTNDTRQEANTALMEVEKGLRSSRVGDQCEAIVKFPSLVDRFPFPILINAAFLKLAEVFRTGINFLRLNILKVLQVTEKHLNKITSVDEFLRRIYAVIHSNDPIARAVTLRVFGSIASIVAERKNVHHSIHHGLESNDRVEADAAIYATSCLCKHSATFAAGVYEKIAGMVQGLTTPVDKKLSLIPILELMYHDIGTAAQVRELCVKLLPSHPSLSLVTALLHTLTRLSLKTLVHISDQVKLLLCYAQGDGRKAIRYRALLELRAIASQVPHMWTQDMIQGLSLVIERASRDQEKASGILTLYILSTSAAVHNMTFLKDKLLPFCYSPSPPISVYALGVVTNITIATHRDGLCEGVDLVEVGGMVTDVCLLTDSREWNGSASQPLSPLKVMLFSLVQLTAVSSEVSEITVETLLSLLPLLSGTQASLVCQTLVSVATHTPKAWSHVTPRLLEYLEATPDIHEILLPVTSILIQLYASEHSPLAREQLESTILPQLFTHLWLMEHPSRLWIAYKLARKASMLGIHEIADPIYSRLSKNVTSVKYRNWLNALCQFSQAQLLVSSISRRSSDTTHLIPALCEASAIVYDAMNLIKASSPPSTFALQFLSVHASWLNTHCQLLSTCVGLSTVPPPSSDLSNSTEKKFHFCVSQFQLVSQQYFDLYSSLFDADPSTLEYITLLQQSCLLMASVISSIACSRKPLVSPGKPSTPSSLVPLTAPVEISDNFNTKFLLGQTCRNVFQRAQAAAESLQSLPMSEDHSLVLTEYCQMVLSVPVRLPQYFFVSLQQTTVKLALSPPLPPPGQQVTLTLDTHLTLKVEGVIEHSGKAKMYRSPSGVYVQVNPTLEKLLAHDVKTPELKSLEQTEPVEKDYFQAQFVLTLPVAGYYAVHIEASLLDDKGTVWHTGHKATMNVLVNSEENFKQQQRQRDIVAHSTRSTSGGEGKQGHRV